MVAFSDNQLYTKLKTAFLYRKEYINGCSCKQAEYVPQTPMPGSERKADAGGGGVPETTGSTGFTKSTGGRWPQVGGSMDPWQPR